MIGKEIFAVNPKSLSEFFEELVVIERVVPPIIIRLDGVNFGKALRDRPLRDPTIHKALVEGCRKLMEFFNADFCHVVSDEINLYMLRNVLYGGRLFKIISVATSILSSFVSLNLGLELYFDSRAISLKRAGLAVPYLLYRVRVGYNNYVSKLYTRYISNSTKKLDNMVSELKGIGIEIPIDWRSSGTCLYLDYVVKERLNPITLQHVKVLRRTIVSTDDLCLCIDRLIGIVNRITGTEGTAIR